MDISYYKKYEPIFGSWHIVQELGEGSFGKVFADRSPATEPKTQA